MGCDYYIDIYLEIEHVNGISYYQLHNRRGWYSNLEVGFYDSDDNSKDKYFNTKKYKKLYLDMVQMCRTCRKPVVLYKNEKFIKKKFQTKYLPLLLDKLNGIYINERCTHPDVGIFTNINEIKTVTRKEIRYEWGDFPHTYPSNNKEEEYEEPSENEDDN